MTIHLPLSEVEKTITTELFKRTIKVLTRPFANTLTVLSAYSYYRLNPHAGEDGHLGRFETDKLIHSYKSKKLKKHLTGTVFADTLFYSENEMAMMSFYACIMTKP